MSEKPDESFDEDEDDDSVDSNDGLDLDEIIRDLDSGKKRRGQRVAASDPAWRKLERYLEDRRTAEQLSDFDDYDIGDEDESPGRKRKS
jgi:hypothetical protein